MSPESKRRCPAFIFITCEHAGNVIPSAYKQRFQGQEAVLETHRGYDIGALAVALKLAERLAAPVQFTETTRLLVDTNRSPDSEHLFSEFTQSLSLAKKKKILDDYYWPHRSSAEKIISAVTQSAQPVLHIAVHSFVDELENQSRDFEIGLLFDPLRASEAEIAASWFAALKPHSSHLRCVSNKPYLGTDDGLTTSFRKMFDADRYAGFEIEIRQGALASRHARHQVACVLASSLKSVNLRN